MEDQNKQISETKKVISSTDIKKSTSLKNIITKIAPEGIDPHTYYNLISNQVMGTDARGNPRPVEDILFFLQTAQKLGLDPSLRQIYPVYRWDGRLGRERMVIQTGIDGLRLVAQRSKQYGGQDDIVFKVEDIFNPITGETIKQLVAVATVYKIVGNTRMPVSASARWHEYAQKAKRKDGTEYYIGMWESMPYNQLAKCAEALVLRKGFPQDLSGIYITEEMEKDRQIKGLELPVPKSNVELKKATEGVKKEVGESAKAQEIIKGDAEKTLLENFAGQQKKS